MAILGDDSATWRPSFYDSSLWGCMLQFRFPVVKLRDYASSWQQLETHDNIFAVVVLAHLKSLETRHDAAERQGWKFRLVRSLYERGLRAVDIRHLFKFIDWMMDLPHGLELLFRQEVAKYKEEQHMPYMTSIERLAREEGLLKGIQVALDIKFGAEGLKLLPEIQQIHDHEKLATILNAIKTADSPDALREKWQGENGK